MRNFFFVALPIFFVYLLFVDFFVIHPRSEYFVVVVVIIVLVLATLFLIFMLVVLAVQ